MNINWCAENKKSHSIHQLMLTKLCTYFEKGTYNEKKESLSLLQQHCIENKSYFGSIRIPKFTFDCHDLQILLQIEFIHGVQLHRYDVKTSGVVIRDLIRNKSDYGFSDFTECNILRMTPLNRLSGAKAHTSGELAYVDLESYGKHSSEYRMTKFRKQVNYV
tara:strand:- start:107 stop:592 length:486 start_codon:yes stop_codon:yes gene_type:complete